MYINTQYVDSVWSKKYIAKGESNLAVSHLYSLMGTKKQSHLGVKRDLTE